MPQLAQVVLTDDLDVAFATFTPANKVGQVAEYREPDSTYPYATEDNILKVSGYVQGNGAHRTTVRMTIPASHPQGDFSGAHGDGIHNSLVEITVRTSDLATAGDRQDIINLIKGYVKHSDFADLVVNREGIYG